MADPEDNVTPISAIVAAGQAFAAEMARQGIHVGWGVPPMCVVCEEPMEYCRGRPRAETPVGLPYTSTSMTPEQYLGVLATVTGAVDALSKERPNWELDEQLDAWDQLDRLHGDLAVIIREHAIELAKNMPSEYLHPRAGLVHTEAEVSVAWDGNGVLRALSRRFVDPETGEVVEGIPVPVLVEVLPAVGEGHTSSKWKVTGLRKQRLNPDGYRSMRWGDKLVRRGPRYSKANRRPPNEGGES